jgi:hypothetical protein
VCCESSGKGEGKEGRKKKRGREEKKKEKKGKEEPCNCSAPMPPLGRGSHLRKSTFFDDSMYLQLFCNYSMSLENPTR